MSILKMNVFSVRSNRLWTVLERSQFRDHTRGKRNKLHVL